MKEFTSQHGIENAMADQLAASAGGVAEAAKTVFQAGRSDKEEGREGFIDAAYYAARLCVRKAVARGMRRFGPPHLKVGVI